MIAKVLSVSSSPTHTMAKPSQESITIVEGLGVEGDAHNGTTVKHRSRVRQDPTQPNLRQIHLIHSELLDELRATGFEIKPGMMGENITTSGVDLLGLPTGAIMTIGANVRLEITGLRNPCAQLDGLVPGLMEAVLDRDSAGELIRKSGVFGIVITGGEVRVDDSISIELPRGDQSRLQPV
jgi:MOSC domain-containing protein YiiM